MREAFLWITTIRPDLKNYNTILYGHNMRDGSMFAKLKEYKNPETLAVCPYFWISTPAEDCLYRIFSVHTAGTAKQHLYRPVSGRNVIPGMAGKNGVQHRKWKQAQS